VSALPTRRDEAWRYSDLAAVERAWPLPEPVRLDVPAGASERRSIVQDGDATVVDTLVAAVGAGASLALDILAMGGDFGRVAVEVTLAEGARLEVNGVVLADGTATREIVTSVTHAEPGAVSRQVVRSVLAGTATGSFLGKVAVTRGAQKTDAVQSVKALLLSRGATANAKPELEIFADDVKCAHGATVGELDANALFYLASRGVPYAEARALLTQAFIADALVGAPDLAERAAAWLRRVA